MKILPRVYYIFKHAINAIWAIPLVIIMRIIYPFILIRVGTFNTQRVGHFVLDAAHHFIKQHNYKANVVNWYWLPDDVCNKQWATMIKRNFYVFKFVRGLDRWNKIIPGGKKHSRPFSETNSNDVEGLVAKSKEKMMEFLPSEDKKARQWLQNQGWNNSDSFVCIMVRDSMYMNSDNFQKKVERGNYDWSYQSYRNSEVHTFEDAMLWLADNGVYVLRMGKTMSNPLGVKHHRIIDYAFNPERSDLLDIWLFSKCRLCISTGSGADVVSEVYKKPILFLNYLPITGMHIWSDSVHMPKKLFWRKTKKLLSYREYIENNYSRTDEYISSGIDIADLSSSEIMNAIQNRWRKIILDEEESISDIELRESFSNTVLYADKFTKYNGFINTKFGMSPVFLRNNPKWLI